MTKNLKKEALNKVSAKVLEKLDMDEKQITKCVEMAGSVTEEVINEHYETGAHHLRILYSRATNTNKATALQLVMDHRFTERAKTHFGLDGHAAAMLKNAVMPAYTKVMTSQVQGRTHVLKDLVAAPV